jgi:cobalt/nickel transport system permease protein
LVILIKMHIPDGFLSTEVWAIMWLASILILAIAVNKTNKKLDEKSIPMLGVLAAFIFAAQMLNTPVAGGTSGHMLGGVLAAILLGPMTASIIMACVFIVQGFFFGDGGITALGANMFNMGFLGTICAYYLYKLLNKLIKGKTGFYASAAIAAWSAVVLASAAAAIELAASGTIPLEIVLPAMVSLHALIGLIEAGITVSVLAFISRTRPDLLKLEMV